MPFVSSMLYHICVFMCLHLKGFVCLYVKSHSPLLRVALAIETTVIGPPVTSALSLYLSYGIVQLWFGASAEYVQRIMMHSGFQFNELQFP